jgi:hypothetical protein
MPSWRRRARAWLAPYRWVASVAFLAVLTLAVLNSIFDWGLLNLHGRKSEAMGALAGLIWFVFVAPTVQELEEMRRTKRES